MYLENLYKMIADRDRWCESVKETSTVYEDNDEQLINVPTRYLLELYTIQN